MKWDVICLDKKKGGLGIKDIFKMNISLLCKWWWKLEKEDGLLMSPAQVGLDEKPDTPIRIPGISQS